MDRRPRRADVSPTGEQGATSEPIWLSHYPPGVPAEIDVHEFASLSDVLLRGCERFAALPAYSNMGATMTYAELDRAAATSPPTCRTRSACARATGWRS